MQDYILATDNTRLLYSRWTTQRSLYSPQTTQDFYTCRRQHKISILATDNTRFYTRYKQHKILYLSQTMQDSILATDNTRLLYSRWTTQRSLYSPQTTLRFLNSSQTTLDFILVSNNTRFYTHYGQPKISILVTIQDFYSHQYTRNGEDKILYSSQTTQDSILGSDNTRLYSPQTSQR